MHVLFWSLFILSFSLGWVNGDFSLEYFLLNYIGVLIIYAILIYGVIYIAYGFFFSTKAVCVGIIILYRFTGRYYTHLCLVLQHH